MAVAGQNARTANYTLALADAGDLVTMSSTGATTIEVPADATANFPVNTIIYIANINTGAVTIAGASGVTVNAQGSLRVLNGQWSTALLMKTAANTWLLTILTRGIA